MSQLPTLEVLAMCGPDVALVFHLQSRLYPPPPECMYPVAQAAIDYCNAGDDGELIELPLGVTWRGTDHMPADAVVRAFRLDAFLTCDDDSDDETSPFWEPSAETLALAKAAGCVGL